MLPGASSSAGLGNTRTLVSSSRSDGELEERRPRLPRLRQRDGQILPGYRDRDPGETSSGSEIHHRESTWREVWDSAKAVQDVAFPQVFEIRGSDHPTRDGVLGEERLEGLE